MKQFLTLLLCGWLAFPLPVVAESAAEAPPDTPWGSVATTGIASLGEVTVPRRRALFSGDQARIGVESALIQYQDGMRVVLGIKPLASFSSTRGELPQKQMPFSMEKGGPLFAASTLPIGPDSTKSAAANVTPMHYKARVSVTEGSLNVVDTSGVQLASLRAGEARLLEEASAAAPAIPPSPQVSGGTRTNRGWLVALGIAIVGTSLAIAALVRANDVDNRTH